MLDSEVYVASCWFNDWIKVDEGKSEVDGDVVVVCKVGSTFTDDGTEAEPASSGLRSTSFAGFVDSCACSISATVAATAL